MFGFDSKYAMFDVTPVENQFILEYLPAAKGDYVRVYLYGLMRCYHPEEDMSLDRICHELNLSEDEVTAAFCYWERRKLVRRMSIWPGCSAPMTNPPTIWCGGRAGRRLALRRHPRRPWRPGRALCGGSFARS